MSRNAAMERIEKGKKRGLLKRFNYIETTPGLGNSGVFCKCGHRVQGFQVVSELNTTERRGSTTLIRERVVLTENTAYTEIEITFDDGSKHITPTCKSCIKKGFSIEMLDDIYAADMSRWEEEERLGTCGVSWDIVGSRESVSWREVTYEERAGA